MKKLRRMKNDFYSAKGGQKNLRLTQSNHTNDQEIIKGQHESRPKSR